MVVKALLIASVTAFYLAIVPRSARADQLVLYLVFKAELVKNMYSLCSAEIDEFRAVIGLDHLWSV